MDPSELVAKGALHCAFALHSPEALHKCDCAVMTICQAPWSTDVVRGPHSGYKLLSGRSGVCGKHTIIMQSNHLWWKARRLSNIVCYMCSPYRIRCGTISARR